MKITRESFKNIVREVMTEESEYQEFFKRALEKTGKSIPDMSDEEKKAFFNKIDSAWQGKGEKNEELVGNQHKLDVDGDGEIEASDLAALRAGKKTDESVSEAKYPTDLKIGSVIMGQGFTRLKGVDGGKYYKVVAMDDTTATLVPSDKNGNQKGSSKVRHKLDSIEGGIKTAKRGDENGIVVIKESINEAGGTVRNPKTGKDVKISTALSYGKSHPAYQAAKQASGAAKKPLGPPPGVKAKPPVNAKPAMGTKVTSPAPTNAKPAMGTKVTSAPPRNAPPPVGTKVQSAPPRNAPPPVGTKVTGPPPGVRPKGAVHPPPPPPPPSGKPAGTPPGVKAKPPVVAPPSAPKAPLGPPPGVRPKGSVPPPPPPPPPAPPKKSKFEDKEPVEEANTISAPGEWVAYLSMTRGKKLLKTFNSARGAKQFLSKNVDKLLGGSNVESVGIMTKKQWDEREAKYAIESVNEASSKEKEIYAKIEKLRVLSNSGKITGDEFLDKFMPLWKQLKGMKSESVVNEASKPTIKVVTKLKNEQGIQIVVVKTTKGETEYGGFVVRGKLQKVIPVGANKTKEDVKKRALQIWDEFGKQLGESVNEGKLSDTWQKNNKKGYVLKVGNIELKSAGPTNTHDILVNRQPWGTFHMDYESGGTDFWVKPLRGNDFWVKEIDDIVKRVKASK